MLGNRFPVHGHLIGLSITITGVDHYPGNDVSFIGPFRLGLATTQTKCAQLGFPNRVFLAKPNWITLRCSFNKRYLRP
jgi:hypothetical protein